MTASMAHDDGDSTRAASWLRETARLGYAAIGVVYVLIAAIATRALLGWSGGENANPKHAMQWLELKSLFGTVALIAIGLGMLGYGAWRGLAAFTDPEHEGASPIGLLKRAGFLISGLTHAGLGAQAFYYAAGSIGAAHPSPSTRGGAAGWTASVMKVPLGRWAVFAVGVGIAMYAVYEVYRSVRWKIRDVLRNDRGPTLARDLTVWLGRTGMAIRAVVIGMIGVLLVRSAVDFDPSKAAGIGKAIAALGAWRYGWYAVAITAIGFAIYGVYQILMARFRKIDVT